MGHGGEGRARPASRGVVSGARSDLRRLNVNALAFDGERIFTSELPRWSTPSFRESENNVVAVGYRVPRFDRLQRSQSFSRV